jgi:hypothetical protein
MSLGGWHSLEFGFPTLSQCTMTYVIISYDYNKALTVPYDKTTISFQIVLKHVYLIIIYVFSH